ncbi:methyl-accepting chemotaxis protein [Litoreibacter roseus]|uniref:Methyl-accepting transducer domain-containing protein n=1 Tax=Litoreibacter roseus TaxID=2601869 RepID=A0A6N6J9X9_9RHOB|nr:methyl-accepting chemotaxis protein [Litoreibacter roseus]GFE63061.1 hypothetical protein KIN_01350 [Litoreibacter roseus]
MNDSDFKIDLSTAMSDAAKAHGALAQIELVRIVDTIRSNGARVSLGAALRLMAKEPAEAEIAAGLCKRAGAAFENAVKMPLTDDAIDGIDQPALKWMRKVFRSDPSQEANLRSYAELVRKLIDPGDAGEDEQRKAIFELAFFTRDVFAHSFLSLYEALYGDLIEQRTQREHTAIETTGKAHEATIEIERVTRMVRLISLNASVEAARAGEAGRGFSIIASEIKTLSDEIAAASADVRDGMTDLVRLLDG